MFKRRHKNSETEFKYELDGNCVVVFLFKGENKAAVSAWSSLRPSALRAIADIEAAADDVRKARDGRPLVEINESFVRMHPEFLASLDASSASAFALPPATTLALDLKPIGRIDEDAFYIQSRWVRPGGQPVRAVLEGPLLKTEGGIRRIPQPLWNLYSAALSLAEPLDKAARFEMLS